MDRGLSSEGPLQRLSPKMRPIAATTIRHRSVSAGQLLPARSRQLVKLRFAVVLAHAPVRSHPPAMLQPVQRRDRAIPAPPRARFPTHAQSRARWCGHAPDRSAASAGSACRACPAPSRNLCDQSSSPRTSRQDSTPLDALWEGVERATGHPEPWRSSEAADRNRETAASIAPSHRTNPSCQPKIPSRRLRRHSV